MNEPLVRTEPVPPEGMPANAPRPKRKRRWWVYTLIGLGCVLLLAGAVVVGLLIYYHSLIRNYTTTQAVSFTPMENANVKQVQGQLMSRWAMFADRVKNRKFAEPFKLTADELNAILAQNKGLRGRVQMVITNDQLVARFSSPLDQGNRRKELKGRYLNGEATLKILLEDGWLTVSVAEIKANGHPIPRWILSKIRAQNLLKDLDNNPEAMSVVHNLDSITFEGDQIVLVPSLPQ